MNSITASRRVAVGAVVERTGNTRPARVLRTYRRRLICPLIIACAAVLFSRTEVVCRSQTTITVDANANRHPISPLIYGVAFGTTAQLTDLNAPLNRSGGNATTRYNWQLNASNHANDW